MPTLPLTAQPNIIVPAGAKKQNATGDAKENFLALLDTGRKTGDFNADDRQSVQGVSGKRRKKETTRAVAAPVTPASLPANNEPRRLPEDNVEKAKKISPVDNEGEKLRPVRPARKKEDAEASSKPEKSNERKLQDDTAGKIRQTEGKENSRGNDDTVSKADATNEPSPTQREESVSEAVPVNNAQATASQAGVPPLGMLEKLQQLTQQFFDDFNNLLTSGGSIDDIVSLIRQFQANIQQALAESQAATGAVNATPIASVALAQPQAQTQTVAIIADNASVAPESLATADQPIATESRPEQKFAQPALVKVDDAQKTVTAKNIADTVFSDLNNQQDNAQTDAKDALLKQTLSSQAVALPVQATPQEAVKTTGSHNPSAHAENIAAVAANANDNRSASDLGNSTRDNEGNAGQSSASLFASQNTGAAKSSDSAGGTSFARLLHSTTQTPVAEQVAVHIKTMIRDGSSNIRVQLNPEELGKLDICIHITADGKTSLIVTADNKDTYELLQRDSRGLEQALADAGLKSDAGSLSFNLRGGQHDREHTPSRSHMPAILQALPEEEPVDLSVISRSYRLDVQQGLDIKI